MSKGKPTTEGTRAERRLGLLLCAPAALVMLVVAGWPIVYSFLLSFQRYDLRFPEDRGWIGFDNYTTVLTNQYWWTAFGITTVIMLISVAIELVLGMALALAGVTAAWSSWAQSPVDTVADAVRDRGYACERAVSAEPDQTASRPDEAVWILTCSNARYRVRFPGDTAPQVEPLDH